MDNRFYGIITVAIVSIVFGLAYKKYKRNRIDSCLYLIILGGLILRIYTSLDLYLHEWDERFHALVAKNLLENPLKPMLYTNPLLDYDYKNWTSNHIWLHKQPFPLYTMAFSMFAFGKNVIALRLPSIVLSTMSIFATFHIGRMLVSKKVGLLAAFLFSINGLIIESSAGRVATDHIDVFFLSLITVAIYFFLKSIESNSHKLFLLGSILTGFAILSKWLPALIVLPIWLLYSIKRHDLNRILKNILVFTSIVLIVVTPWQIYIMHNFPLEAAWEYGYNSKHIFEDLSPFKKPFYYHFDRMRILFGELTYIPLIWFVYYTYLQSKKQNYNALLILVWILIPYLFFSLVVTKMQGYILFCSSAIFIMISIFFDHLGSNLSKLKEIKLLILVLLIALPVRYSLERIKPFTIRDRNPAWIDQMKDVVSRDSSKAVLFNCKYPIATMFYTDVIAYETIPDLEKLKLLNIDGFKIYIDNHKPLGPDVKDLEFVNYIEVTGDNSIKPH